MSTINKTFLRVLLAIACCIALAFSLLPQADAAMRADVVTGKVTLNGQVIDNKNAKYPLLTYSNITYFPMTYHLSRFMGVSTDWNGGSKTLDITAGARARLMLPRQGKSKAAAFLLHFPAIRSALTTHRSITRKKSIPFSITTESPISRSHGLMRSTLSAGAISGML